MGNLLAPLTGPFNLFFYEPIYNLLMGIYQLIHLVLPAGAFAAAIIVLTLLLRCCMIPLTRKQLKSSREMQVLQPKLKELQAQYKNNPQELMAAQRALYKEHGVSPMSGCLPLLVQMPFLYALYGAFLTVLPRTGQSSLNHINHDLYPFVPHLTALPSIQFLWTSLGTPDPLHILPVLAAILTFVQLRMAMPVRKKPAPGTASQPDPTTQATSMMQYIMPFFTLFIGWTFPAGLALYWCVSTGFSAVQQYFISGWGSLFVGVPGMEHLVPEPKALPTLSTARAPAGARALTAPASAASSSQPEQGGGLRGMFKQIRDSMAAAQSQAQTQAAQQAEQRTPQSQAQPKPQATQPSGAGSRSDSTGAGTPSRRARTLRGPVLIKPATGAESAESAESPGTPSVDELPEKAIARDASGGMPDSNGELPEQTIARLATSNGANGASSASSANGTNGAKDGASAKRAATGAAGTPRPSGASSTGARSGSSQRKQSGKNMNAPRPRGSRPKGGR